MGIIKADDLVFDYIRRDEEGNVENVTEASALMWSRDNLLPY